MSKARDLADLAKNANDRLDDVATSDGALSHRNLIINGAMTVWQKGTSATSIGTDTRVPDRLGWYDNTTGAYTAEQSTDAPDGFAFSVKMNVTTADTSLAAGEYAFSRYPIEAQDLQHLKYGTSDAKTLTLSFWVKSNKTGTYCVSLYKPDNTALHFSKEYTIDTADTWEKKIVKIAPDSNVTASTGAIDNNTDAGLIIYHTLAIGSTYTGATDGTWSTTPADYATSNQVNWLDSTSNNFYLTGIQLEVGETATSFEHRSYGEELRRCQRYLFKMTTGDALSSAGSINYDGSFFDIKFPVTMRAAPTLLATGMTDYGDGDTEYRVYVMNSSGGGFLNAPTTDLLYISHGTVDKCRLVAAHASGWFNSAIDSGGAALDVGTDVKLHLTSEI